MTDRNFRIELARTADADAIAEMSRDAIEHGLGWRWTRNRVVRCIGHDATNVIVARAAAGDPRVIGFAIMQYQDGDGEEAAHLLLFAVSPSHRRQGVGSALLSWLEATATTAGIGLVRLEARITNRAARAFYAHHGYREGARVRGLYRGVEDGIRIAKDLWASSPDASRTST
jgi:ribosomal-protein-alanine N-acetyltransferase